MNAQHSERCESCQRVKGTPGGNKRPARYCWLQHGETCRNAELWHLRSLRGVVKRARALISTPRGTPAHLQAELELVRSIAAVDMSRPPRFTEQPLPSVTLEQELYDELHSAAGEHGFRP